MTHLNLIELTFCSLLVYFFVSSDFQLHSWTTQLLQVSWPQSRKG